MTTSVWVSIPEKSWHNKITGILMFLSHRKVHSQALRLFGWSLTALSHEHGDIAL